jgi:hypothetical protein
MTSDEKLDFLFAWCTSMDRTIESEKVQMQAMSVRIREVEERARRDNAGITSQSDAIPLNCGDHQLVKMCLSGSSQNAQTAEPITSRAAAT